MNYDLLLMGSQLLLTVGPVIVLFSRSSYITRRSSALLVLGLVGMTVALLGLHANLGASATAVGALAWGAVFVIRGRTL